MPAIAPSIDQKVVNKEYPYMTKGNNPGSDPQTDLVYLNGAETGTTSGVMAVGR